MSGFSKDKAIIAQNSATVASAVVAAIISQNPDHITTTDSALELFDTVREHIFNGSLRLADAADGVVPDQAPRGGGRAPRGGGRPQGGGSGASGGDFVFPFGKHKGKTVADVAAMPPGDDGRDGASYLTWYIENGTAADVVEHIKTYLSER